MVEIGSFNRAVVILKILPILNLSAYFISISTAFSLITAGVGELNKGLNTLRCFFQDREKLNVRGQNKFEFH